MRFKSRYDIPYGHKRMMTLDISGMSSERPKIVRDACIECGNCCLFCPTGAVSLDDDGIHVILEFCKGCGTCSRECPATAIAMIEIRDK